MCYRVGTTMCLLFRVLLSFSITQYMSSSAESTWTSNFNLPILYPCDYVYYYDLGGWFKLHHVPATWHAARNRCKLEGAELVSPQNKSLFDAMVDSMNYSKVNTVFTGIHSTYSYGDYFSIKGVPLDRMPVTWAQGGPSTDKDKRSVVFFVNGTIFNENENISHPYFCYKQDRDEPLSNCGTIDQGYQYVSQLNTCYKFHTTGKTWEDAFNTCAAEGGHLAIINDDEEYKSIQRLFHNYFEENITASSGNYIFVGIIDWEHSGQWFTIHGETLEEAGFSKWQTEEPSDPKNEFCGTLKRYEYLCDGLCSLDLPFICEKSPSKCQRVYHVTFLKS